MNMTAARYRAGNKAPVNYKARGSVKSGEMNKLESKYAAHLENLRLTGEIVWWKWDAINLRLGDNCHYRPDFLVLKSDMTLEIHETKGYMQEDALVKLKVAAASFPFTFILIKWVKSTWEFTTF